MNLKKISWLAAAFATLAPMLSFAGPTSVSVCVLEGRIHVSSQSGLVCDGLRLKTKDNFDESMNATTALGNLIAEGYKIEGFSYREQGWLSWTLVKKAGQPTD